MCCLIKIVITGSNVETVCIAYPILSADCSIIIAAEIVIITVNLEESTLVYTIFQVIEISVCLKQAGFIKYANKLTVVCKFIPCGRIVALPGIEPANSFFAEPVYIKIISRSVNFSPGSLITAGSVVIKRAAVPFNPQTF